MSQNICFLKLLEEFPKDSKTSSNQRVIGMRVIDVILQGACFFNAL